MMTKPCWIGASIAIAVALAPEPALAKPRKPEPARKACEKNSTDARKLESEGQLAAAQKLLKRCAVPACGTFLERQCSSRYAVIDADIPSVVPVVVDDKGEPVVDVEVTMDGERLVGHLDGRATRTDPGLHQFTFKRADGQEAKRSILVAQGQRNLRVEVTMAAPGAPEKRTPVEQVKAERPAPVLARLEAEEPAAAPPRRGEPKTPAPEPRRFERRHRSKAGAYLMLTTGMVGLGGGALLTYWGRTDNDKLAECTPDCPPASVKHIRQLYLAADISLGVGAAALVTGFLLRWRAGGTYQVEVEPHRGGGVATLSRAF